MISIGKIGKPIGVKGEVRVLPLTSNILRYKGLKHIYLPEKREVEYFKFFNKKVILKVKGIDTYNDAYFFLRGKEIKIPEKETIEKGEDEFFFHELVGLRIKMKDGNYIGSVIGIVEAGNEILVVKYEGREVLIPFVKEFCKSVDIKKGEIVVDIPDELLNLNKE